MAETVSLGQKKKLSEPEEKRTSSVGRVVTKSADTATEIGTKLKKK